MNPVTTWDVTAPANDTTPEQVMDHLNEIARNWCFQKERGEQTGYVHWQIRLHLRKKMRQPQALSEISIGPLAGAHISPTTTHCMGDNFYVMKHDTRVAGPWRSDDKVEEDEPGWDREGAAIADTLRPWQREVMDRSTEYDPRTIYYVMDEGHTGKSSLATLMEMQGKAMVIPPTMREGRDLMRMVMNTRDRVRKAGHNTYIIDIPRSVDMRKLVDIWGAIESIKNGSAYDDRYTYKRVRFPRPNIFVFCNKMPPVEAFTADRWVRIHSE